MSEFTYIPDQTVPYRQAAALNSTTCGCGGNGRILHREGSGIVTARGITNNRCSNYARYEVKYSGNISLPTGAAVGPIALALTIDGEPLAETLAVATPAAVGDRWNVSGFANIDVPRGCCYNISVENLSPSAGATPNPDIVISNLDVTVNPVNRIG